MAMTAARFPDLAEGCLRALLHRGAGTSNRLGVSQAVLSNGVFLDRRINLDMMVTSPRNTLQFSVYRSERTTLTSQDFALTGDLRRARG
jgi:hypothetical protein